MSNADNNLYQFDNFRLDTTERSLRRGDELVPLPPKVLDVLFLLVEKNGGIVSKKELMDAVWADAFVEESNLTQNIYTLRRTLGKSEVGQDFIETVPRRGYRFAVPVSVVENQEGETGRRGDGEIENQSFSSDFVSLDVKTFAETKTFTPSPFHPFSPSLLIICIVAIALLLASATGFYFFPAQVSRNAEAPIEKVAFQKLTYTGDVSLSVISPDGKSFAYVKDNGIFLQEIGTEKATRINVADAKVFGILQFSADGNSLYFRNQRSLDLAGSVFEVSRYGGVPKLVLENVWSGYSFSPDGKQAAFIRFYPHQNEFSLVLKNLDSGEERNLLTRRPPKTFYLDASPAWSADGKRLAFVNRNEQQPVWQIVVCELESGKTETLETPRVAQIGHLAWLPDGKSLVVSARENQQFYQLWRVAFPSGELSRLTNDLNVYRGISLSADGKRLLTTQHVYYSHIWTASAEDLENFRQITFGNQNRDGLQGLTWTPDGNLVYVSRIIGDLDLWTLRPNDGTRQRLTENAGSANLNPKLSSDGKYIYFHSNRSRGSHIWRMDANGENPVQVTFSENENEFFPLVSPDGNWLYYVQRGPKTAAVWRKSLVDEKTERLTEPGKVSPSNFISLSPDGRFLAFHNLTETVEAEEGKQTFQICVIATGEPREPRFITISASRGSLRSTDGDAAFDYVENTSEGAKIWRQSIDEKTPPQLILNLPKDHIFSFAWSADGKNLALARGRHLYDAVLLTNFQP